MISVKRFSVVLGLVYGGLIFKEKNIAIRTIGTLLVVAGAVVIAIRGSWVPYYQKTEDREQ